jgi:hypothetical protein
MGLAPSDLLPDKVGQRVPLWTTEGEDQRFHDPLRGRGFKSETLTEYQTIGYHNSIPHTSNIHNAVW